jgi:hypothetical protein
MGRKTACRALTKAYNCRQMNMMLNAILPESHSFTEQI